MVASGAGKKEVVELLLGLNVNIHQTDRVRYTSTLIHVDTQ